MRIDLRAFFPLSLIAAVTLTAASASAVRKSPKKVKKTVKSAQQIATKSDSWGLVNVASACLRTEPAHASQLETQASYGTPVKILEKRGEWYKVELPDGYKAWIIGSSIVERTSSGIDQWKQSPRLIVTLTKPASAYSDSLSQTDGNIAFDIVIGSIFDGKKTPGAKYTGVSLPDGRKGYVKSEYVADFATWSQRQPEIDTIMNTARSMMGVTYLWGGTTPKAIDCSGFTKVCYGAAGLILPRNASQQARIGRQLDITAPETFRQGDLLFFGTGNGTVVTHVGIYDGFSRFIHASGRVFESSFNPSNPLYIPRKVIGACRILGVENPSGITPYAKHPWYF